MDERQLSLILKQNEDNVAFVVGNGIHRYFKSAISWEELMEKLWGISSDTKNNIPNNIPNTELYDIIELRYLESCRNKNKAAFLECLNSLLPLMRTNTKEGFAYQHCFTNNGGELQTTSLTNLMRNTALSQSEKIIEKRSHELFKEYGLPTNSTCTFSDINVALELATETGVYNHLFLKHFIKKLFCNCELDKRALAFVSYAKRINAPILTTNYDEALSKLMTLDIFSFSSYFDDKKYLFPLSSYFSDKERSGPLDGFSIWHINGMIEFQNSIRLGLCDYMDLTQQLREGIDVCNEAGFESLASVNSKDWRGKNTWLEIFFKKHLFIFGLGLNEDEIPLRWLLIQRAKYNQMFDKNLKCWYIAPFCEKEKSIAKETFMKSVNVEMLYVDDYPTIYEKVWEIASHD